MEQRPSDNHEQNDSDIPVSAKKRRTGGNLAQYLFRKREQEGITSELDSDDTEEEEDNPKKLRRLFRRIFPRLVELTPQSASVEPQKSGFDLETWLSWSGKRSQDSAANVAEPLNVAGPSETSHTVAEPISSTAFEQVLNENIQNEPSKTAAELPTLEQLDSIHEDEDTEKIEASDYVREPAHVFNEAAVNIPNTDVNNDFYSNSQIENAYNKNVETTTKTAEPEIIIERKGSSVLPIALIGAEYIGRKRADRKLQTALSSQTEKLAERVSRIESEETTTHDRQTVLQAMPIEREIRLNNRAIELQPNRSQKQDVAQYKADTLERSISQSAVQAEVAPKITDTDAPVNRFETSESFKPQKILEKVAEAADSDSPVERVFERSHEVKDDTVAATGASWVGSVAASRLSTNDRIVYPKGTESTPQPSSKVVDIPVIQESNTPDEYRKAMAAGFSAALVIIVVGCIAYLMVK